MSGHSKWHNIQAKKGKADKARANAFTKLARAITMAAQTGGGDVETNFALRLAIDKARAANMPKDNIDRAIKRGTGALKEGAAMHELMYEGYGPGGVALLIEAVTDNPTRTASDVKHMLSKHGGSLGAPGSVRWQFVHLGVVRIDSSQMAVIFDQRDAFELALMDAGVADMLDQEGGMEIRFPKESFQRVLEAVHQFVLEPPADSGLEWISKEPVHLDSMAMKALDRFYDALHDLDDISEVYTNAA